MGRLGGVTRFHITGRVCQGKLDVDGCYLQMWNLDKPPMKLQLCYEVNKTQTVTSHIFRLAPAICGVLRGVGDYKTRMKLRLSTQICYLGSTRYDFAKLKRTAVDGNCFGVKSLFDDMCKPEIYLSASSESSIIQVLIVSVQICCLFISIKLFSDSQKNIFSTVPVLWN